MEKKGVIVSVIIGILLTAFFTWTGISLLLGQELNEENNDEEDEVNILISGSTTCFPVIVRCAADYEDENDEYSISVSGGGSSKGISDVLNNLVDVGMASRPMKSTESSVSGMTQTAFANDGIALVMSAGNSHFDGNNIPQWYMEDVLKVFNGTYRYWDDVPGCSGSEQIILVGRDSASGTRASFEEITGLEDDSDYSDIVTGTHSWQTIAELNSNGAVHDSVATDEDAIGYVGLGYVDSAVDSIDLWSESGASGPGFYQATAENVKNGDYAISRKLYLVYKAPIDSDIEDFIDWVKGSDGQKIVEDEGFITL